MATILHAAFAAAHPTREAQAAHFDEQDRIADEALRRRRADRVDPPPVLSRADKIIKAGDDARRAYRDRWPGADTAMVYGAQIGHLHGEIRRLCAELEAPRDPGLSYCDVESSVGTVVVGYGYLPAVDEGDVILASQVEVREVYVCGVDLYRWVPDDELDRIADEVLAKHEAKEAAKAARSMCRADES